MKLYAGNLSFNMTDSSLSDVFKAFGEVTEASIVIDRGSGRSKGFGFIEMPNQAEAEEAIKQLDGKDVDGRNIKVSVAKPKEERPSRY
jgi:RNA recognition motif-containing protein